MEYAYLRVKTPEGERPEHLSSIALTIGRHESNRLIIKDSMASRFHCVVEASPTAGYMLRDLQSRNGTLLNGQRVMTASLKNGDIITIGAVQMTVVIHAVSPSLAADKAGAPAPASDAEALDDLEVITDEQDDDAIPLAAPAGDEPEAILRKAADAMPRRDYDVADIGLTNPRGQALHASGKPGGSGDAVYLLRLILLLCFRSHATDIHFEPRTRDFLLRIRMDGNLLDVTAIDLDVGTRLVALVKVLCELDTTQRQIVQEGHFASVVPNSAEQGDKSPRAAHRRVDYRVSFVPSLHGQKMVIRIFDAANAPLLLPDLELPQAIGKELSEELTREGGLILVCGPTGSGKTTTLYALLRSCGSSFRNIVTIEDPVEIQLEGTTQLPVDDQAGKGFAALLRSVLRQDPDVIMVGEIRDPETARIALQASMTGHLVLSTIHTRDTVGTIFRLLDLGIDGYMVAQGLQLVLAQRLVRALCTSCRRPYAPTADDRRRLGKAGERVEKIYAPMGCPRCFGTGFLGRRAFFEFLRTTDNIREKIMRNPNSREIHDALDAGFISLSESGFQLVAGGITSIDEVERAVGH